MKKLFTLLLLTLTAFTLKSTAQTISCNALFTYSITGFTANFTPAQPGDITNTQHSWTFGDNSSSSAVSPSHTYSAPGTYHVVHHITRSLVGGTWPMPESGGEGSGSGFIDSEAVSLVSSSGRSPQSFTFLLCSS